MNNSRTTVSPRVLIDWIKTEPVSALFLVAIIATFVIFYGFVPLFVKGVSAAGLASTAAWAWQAWNPAMNQEHSKIVPLISLFLVWCHRKEIRAAPKKGSNVGLIFISIGILLFILSARCLQPRFALASLPFLIFGSVVYLWGFAVGRLVFFPCAFLLFLIPVAALEQATFRLQFIITESVGFLCRLMGIKVNSLGTVLNAADQSFHFHVDEGCSGVRSLMAITMLSAIYGHLTQDALWKKVVLVAAAVLFAIIGNTGRLISIILVAKFFGADLAGGPYHAISGYLSFPFALAAMVLFGRLLNLKGNRKPASAPIREDVPLIR